MSGNEGLGNMTVLYVEDEPILREEIVRYLKRRVGRLQVGENGQEGLALYKETQPEIIITDLKMPVMDGLTMARTIREKDLVTPIIIMTAVSELEQMQTSIEVGIERYMLKPVNASELTAVLERSASKVMQMKQGKMTHIQLKQSSEQKRNWEKKIQAEIARLTKTTSGKGPLKVEAALYANIVEITLTETRTPLEHCILRNPENVRLGDYIREVYYKELSKEIEGAVSEITGLEARWFSHRCNGAKDKDILKLMLD